MDGQKLAPTRAAWLDAVDYLARAHCNRQRHRNLMHLAWQLATRTDATMMTAPKRGATWIVLGEEVGVSRRTIAYLVKWLREHGLLVVVMPGSTPRTRRGNLWGRFDDGQGNLATEYALTAPAELLGDDELQPLKVDAVDDADEVPWPVETVTERPTFSHVSEGVENLCTPVVSGLSLARTLPNAGARDNSVTTEPAVSWPRLESPGTRKDQLAACERLRTDNGITLGILSVKDLRSMLRLAFAAGWTVADVEHALNWRPDGQHWGDIDPGRLAGTVERKRGMRSRIRHRMGLWIAADGTPLVRSASQQAADEEAAMWQEEERRLDLALNGEPEPEPAAQVVVLKARRTPTEEYLTARATMEARLKEGA
ncbi:hypothetical protein [Streptosporangium lutulentum]|uniref:Helix-turn-helix domain-containing protein n=1 Tax=Streptosporangium lutulentum TaxID=1461250 RepID=A0ABT9Q9D2_9ACTN|nr:hypothetical protein [Streptosporangium lutulentum]MDP9843356.1 hypothetical protein [Streptosporangium lutulentum]